MKKILCTLVLMLVAFMTHAQMLPETGASRIPAVSTKTGDVNGDYKVNVDDVVMIIQYLIEQAGSDFLTFNADVNRDGVITISDAVATAMLVFEGDKPQSYLSCPDNHHPHLIDLGLPSGTKWACCNVGADKPEAYGGYYAWGETEEKTSYDESNYLYYKNGSYVSIGDDIAGTQYDVAHVKWGGNWVMPSYDQIQELLDNCTYRPWTTENGVNGRRFFGSNGGCIFLPAAGYRFDDVLDYAGSDGGYWSSAQDSSFANWANYLHIYSGGADWYFFGRARSNGRSVRPVYVEKTPSLLHYL